MLLQFLEQAVDADISVQVPQTKTNCPFTNEEKVALFLLGIFEYTLHCTLSRCLPIPGYKVLKCFCGWQFICHNVVIFIKIVPVVYFSAQSLISSSGTFSSRLRRSPRNYSAIPRTVSLSKHHEHMYRSFSVFKCVCKRQRERETETW